MSNEPIPIDDDELVYRRIPVRQGWYANGVLSPQAFHPRRDEISGISVERARFKSIEDAARGPSPDGYHVAVLKVADLRASGLHVVRRPEVPGGYDEAHAELPDLNAGNRRSDEAIHFKETLVVLAGHRPVMGPFTGISGGTE